MKWPWFMIATRSPMLNASTCGDVRGRGPISPSSRELTHSSRAGRRWTGLVHEEDLGFHGDRAGDDPLPLSAGGLCQVVAEQFEREGRL
jgi:hypothetical protein